MDQVHDWVVIGGGVHGTHITIRLLSANKDQSPSIRIMDPNHSLLCNWRHQTASTKMKYLRSPSVHNLDLDPFALKKFAGKKPIQRRKKFSPPYDRPSLDFFNMHCDSLIKEYSLDTIHDCEAIRTIDLKDDSVILESCSGRLVRTKRIVLSLGQSEKLNFPYWCNNSLSHVDHIFSEGFNWKQIENSRSIAVIGGGITAIQTALYAESLGVEVHLICRHRLRKHQFDSDPGWLGPKFMASFSKERDFNIRRQLISASRNAGSIPQELFSRLMNLISAKRIQSWNDEVVRCKEEQKITQLILRENQSLNVNRVILATGFEKQRPGGAMLDDLIKKYQLPVSDCGYPIVDKSLAWHPKIYVSGSLAELEIGPIAKNISGARVAAERILSA